MSLISDLFKQQPGGTTTGNIIRDITKQLTNGAFGTGANKQTQRELDVIKLTAAEFELKYGETKQGVPAKKTVGEALKAVADGVHAATFWSVVQQFWYVILIPVVVLFALGWYFYRGRKQRGYKR